MRQRKPVIASLGVLLTVSACGQTARPSILVADVADPFADVTAPLPDRVDPPVRDAVDAAVLDVAAPIDARGDGAPDDAPDVATPDVSADAPAADVSPVQPTGPVATTYQINAAHTGYQPAQRLALPLTRRWMRDFGAATSYAVIASGVAYVTVRNTGRYGTALHALDLATGENRWGPIELGGTYYWSGLAYDAGVVFAMNYSGELRALDAATGAVRWTSRLPGQSSFSSEPSAANGMVFVGGAGSGGTLYAVRQGDGTVAWSASVANGDHSSPAVGGGGVYVSYACNRAYGFEAVSGLRLWTFMTGCSGGGGRTTALYGGAVYTRDHNANLVLDAVTGNERGRYESTTIPAFANDVGYYLHSGTLRAIPVGATTPRWTFRGDGALAIAPVVVGAHVVVGSSNGVLYALTAADGAVAGMDTLPSIGTPDEHNVSSPLAGISAGSGALLVTTARGVAAYDAPVVSGPP